MQKQWTDRAIKGAKYLAAGVFLIMAREPALGISRGNHLLTAIVLLVCGVIGPVIAVAGLYLVGTRNKQSK